MSIRETPGPCSSATTTDLNLTGTIYAPASQFDVTGYGNQTLNVGSQIIADTIRVENNAKVNIGYNFEHGGQYEQSGTSSSTSTFALVK